MWYVVCSVVCSMRCMVWYVVCDVLYTVCGTCYVACDVLCFICGYGAWYVSEFLGAHKQAYGKYVSLNNNISQSISTETKQKTKSRIKKRTYLGMSNRSAPSSILVSTDSRSNKKSTYSSSVFDVQLSCSKASTMWLRREESKLPRRFVFHHQSRNFRISFC